MICVLSLLSVFLPGLTPWMPDMQVSDDGSEVRIVLRYGSPAAVGKTLWVDAELKDEMGRTKCNSQARGLALAVRPGEKDNDPLLARSVDGLGPGGMSITFGSLEASYAGCSTSRVLPGSGPFMLVVKVLPESKKSQR